MNTKSQTCDELDIKSDNNADTLPMEYETIYVGNLRFENMNPQAKHSRQAILFVSTKCDELSIPQTIETVIYKTLRSRKYPKGRVLTISKPPFFHSINIYGSFSVYITIIFKTNTEVSPNYNKSKHYYSSFIPKRDNIGGDYDAVSVHMISMDHSISISGIDPILRTKGIIDDGEDGETTVIVPRFHYNNDYLRSHGMSNMLEFCDNNEELLNIITKESLKDSNEISSGQTSRNHFNKTKFKLQKSLKGRSTVIMYKRFNGNLDTFVTRFHTKQVNITKESASIDKLDRKSGLSMFLGIIPLDILVLIGKYYTFDMNTPVRSKYIGEKYKYSSMQYAIEIINCHNCQINLRKLSLFKQLDIIDCSNIYIQFNNTTTSQCEVFTSDNVTVDKLGVIERPSGFRVDTCKNCIIHFKDSEDVVRVTTFGCIGTQCNVNGIQHLIPDQTSSNDGYITNWRGDGKKTPEFTGQVWAREDALQTR